MSPVTTAAKLTRITFHTELEELNSSSHSISTREPLITASLTGSVATYSKTAHITKVRRRRSVSMASASWFQQVERWKRVLLSVTSL